MVCLMSAKPANLCKTEYECGGGKENPSDVYARHSVLLAYFLSVAVDKYQTKLSEMIIGKQYPEDIY